MKYEFFTSLDGVACCVRANQEFVKNTQPMFSFFEFETVVNLDSGQHFTEEEINTYYDELCEDCYEYIDLLKDNKQGKG